MGKTIRIQQGSKLAKLYNSMIGSHQLWELWQDSMEMFAISISNTVDFRYYDKRESTYMALAKKYTKDELLTFCKILAEITIELEENPEQDLLGGLYMALDLGSHWHGQFFTPYNVCAMMASVQCADDIADSIKKPISIFDCACGGGATLIAAAHEYTKTLKKRGLIAQEHITIYAQDISPVCAMMCYIQLSLQGFAAKVKVGDSLLDPLLKSDNGANIWYTPMYLWQNR